MTAGELLGIVRADYLDDATAPFNWSDASLLREIGRAQQQACYRQDLRHLFDAESFTITVTDGVRSYPLDAPILRLEEVAFDGTQLTHTTRADLDAFHHGWRNNAPGKPQRFYVTGRTLYLDRDPGPDQDGLLLTLQVWREPAVAPTDMADDDDLEWLSDPEQLAHWVCFKAYSRRDEDTQDKAKALEHLALFNATFGAEVPAQARAELLAYPPTLTFRPAISSRTSLTIDSDTW